MSNTLAASLWALDYLHWWAAQGAMGINFHTGDSVAAGNNLTPCYYATYWTSPNGYNIHPIGYGIKAFDLGRHGQIVQTTITSAQSLNITAYTVAADKQGLFITVINKEHGPTARSATVILATGVDYNTGRMMLLTSSNGDVADTDGITLGGASIDDDASWNGKWTPITQPFTHGAWIVHVPPRAAAVINLMAGQ